MTALVAPPRSTLVDARWLGSGGIGRVTEQAIAGIGVLAPPGEWIVWARDDHAAAPIAGARTAHAPHHPKAFAGQRDVLHVPSADRALFLGNVRPFRPLAVPTVSVLYDAIRVRTAASRAAGWPMVAFLRAAGAAADTVVTISHWSARCLVDDVGLDPRRIRVAHLPVNRQMVERVEAARRSAQPCTPPTIVCVGRGDDYKNLRRLVHAFARTRASLDGARLVLVGAGLPAGVPETDGVVALGSVSQARLEAELVGATLAVQPSLEEGFGLPLVEALASGVPVVASDIPVHREVVGDRAPLFDPRSEAAITAAIDDALADGLEVEPQIVRWAREQATEVTLAAALLEALDEATHGGRRWRRRAPGGGTARP